MSKNVESYREQAQASAADLAVINLSLHATLAVDYFAARSLDAEEKLLEDTVAQYQQAFQLNEDRYQGGLASEVEVEQARTILETTRAQMIDVEVARSQFEHAVTVFIGKPPGDLSLPPLPLTTPPPPIPVGIPSELLERRPDIASIVAVIARQTTRCGRSRWYVCAATRAPAPMLLAALLKVGRRPIKVNEHEADPAPLAGQVVSFVGHWLISLAVIQWNLAETRRVP